MVGWSKEEALQMKLSLQVHLSSTEETHLHPVVGGGGWRFKECCKRMGVHYDGDYFSDETRVEYVVNLNVFHV